VEGRPVVLVYRSHQGTVVLDSAVGTVRRRQYRHNRSTSKTQSKNHHGGKALQTINNQQSTISPQTNTIDNSPTMRAMLCSWWEKEECCDEGTKGRLNLYNGCVGPDTKWSSQTREFLDVTLPAKIRRYVSTKGSTMAA
jgi:hypothetical protein